MGIAVSGSGIYDTYTAFLVCMVGIKLLCPFSTSAVLPLHQQRVSPGIEPPCACPNFHLPIPHHSHGADTDIDLGLAYPHPQMKDPYGWSTDGCDGRCNRGGEDGMRSLPLTREREKDELESGGACALIAKQTAYEHTGVQYWDTRVSTKMYGAIQKCMGPEGAQSKMFWRKVPSPFEGCNRL